MKKFMINLLCWILALLPFVTVAMAQPTLVMNPENTDQTAWFIYLPSWEVRTQEAEQMSVEKLHGEPIDLDEELEYARIYINMFFPEHRPVIKDGEVFLYRPEKSKISLTWQTPYRVTPWFDDK